MEDPTGLPLTGEQPGLILFGGAPVYEISKLQNTLQSSWTPMSDLLKKNWNNR